MILSNKTTISLKDEIPEPASYFRLFETTGWNEAYGVDRNLLFKAVSVSWYCLCAYHNEKELVGFGRLISDGVLYAFVCDMIITPDWQRKGIGSAILEKLIQHCKNHSIKVVWLFSASGKVDFYKKHGFEERP